MIKLSLALQIFKAFFRILLIVNLPLNQTPDIPILCKTNLGNSIDSGNFYVRGYLPLIWKDSTNMYPFTVHVREELPFLLELSL